MSERKSKDGKNAASTPHDLASKQFLTHPDTARDFMQLHLPPHLQAVCVSTHTFRLRALRVATASKQTETHR